jgi:hypothetical protein
LKLNLLYDESPMYFWLGRPFSVSRKCCKCEKRALNQHPQHVKACAATLRTSLGIPDTALTQIGQSISHTHPTPKPYLLPKRQLQESIWHKSEEDDGEEQVGSVHRENLSSILAHCRPLFYGFRFL